MARLPRLTLAGYTHHVIQRGKQSLFYTDDDRQAYLAWLAEYAKQYNVAVHAYALLDEQTHLVLTPLTVDGVPRLMQALSRRYARYLNQFHKRSGTVWDERYKSTLIEAGLYLMPLLALIDHQALEKSNSWSSHAHYSGEKVNGMLTSHPIIWTLGNTPFAREKAYKEFTAHGVSAALQNEMMSATNKAWALGSAAFLNQLQSKISRRVSKRQSGRPVKI